MKWCSVETVTTSASSSQDAWQMFPLEIKNIPRCPCEFAAMSWSASVQFGNHGYKPYWRGKNQAGLQTDWMCRDNGLPDLKLRVLGGKWNQQETNTQKGADQAAKSLGITVQRAEMIPNTVYLQIFRNILASFKENFIENEWNLIRGDFLEPNRKNILKPHHTKFYQVRSMVLQF